MAKVLLYKLPEKAKVNFLEAWGKNEEMKIIEVHDPATILNMLANEMPDVLIMGEVDEDAFEKIKTASIDTTYVVALEDFKSQRAYNYMKKGAFDCIAPPYEVNEWLSIINYANFRKGQAGFLVYKKKKGLSLRFLKKIAIYIGVFLIISVVLSIIYTNKLQKINEFEAKLPQVLELPQAGSGIFFDGKEFLISDWMSQSVTFLDENLKIKSIYKFPELQIIHIIKVEDKYYSVSTDGGVRLHSKIDSVEKLYYKTTMPAGVAYSIGRVYVADIIDKRLYEIVSPNAVTSYRLKYTPFGIASYKGKVFIGEAETKSILEYPTYKRYYFASHLKQTPLSFAVYDNYFYFIFENSVKMYKIYYGN
ncbi:MAG: hypothetical protein NZ870_02585 [bacterium]|nr:hypothetical protein [bacterium]